VYFCLLFYAFLIFYFLHCYTYFPAQNSQSISESIHHNANHSPNTIILNNKSENIPKRRILTPSRFATPKRRLFSVPDAKFLSNYELRIEAMKLHPYRTYSHFGLNISTMKTIPRHFHFPDYPTRYVPLKRSESVDCYFSSPDFHFSTGFDSTTKLVADVGVNVLSEIVDRSLDIYFTKHDTGLATISPIKDDLLKIFEDQLRHLKADGAASTFLNKLSDMNYSKLSLSGAACPNLDAEKFTKVWDCIPYIEFGDNQDKSYASIIDSTVKSIESGSEVDPNPTGHSHKLGDSSMYLNGPDPAQEEIASGSGKKANSISSSTPSNKGERASNLVGLDISNVTDDNNNDATIDSKQTTSRTLSRIPVLKYRCRYRHQASQPFAVDASLKTKKSGQRRQMTKKKSTRNYIAENIQNLSRPNSNIKAKSTDSISSFKSMSLKKSHSIVKSSSIDGVARFKQALSKNNEELMFQDLNRDTICISQQIDRQAILIGQMDLSKVQDDCHEIFLLHKNLEQDMLDRKIFTDDMVKEIDRIRNLEIME
jgi:hypothetical protein